MSIKIGDPVWLHELSGCEHSRQTFIMGTAITTPTPYGQIEVMCHDSKVHRLFLLANYNQFENERYVD